MILETGGGGKSDGWKGEGGPLLHSLKRGLADFRGSARDMRMFLRGGGQEIRRTAIKSRETKVEH